MNISKISKHEFPIIVVELPLNDHLFLRIKLLNNMFITEDERTWY